MDESVNRIIDMLRDGKQPSFVTELKNHLAVKGEFVGYSTIDYEPMRHLGTDRDVYAVKVIHLVRDRQRASNYREWLKTYDVNVDYLIQYTQTLEMIVCRLTEKCERE